MSNFKCRTMIRSSFSILFSIRESKVRKNGNAPIEVTITLNGERSYFSTGKTVPFEKWDKTRQQVIGKDEEAKSLNNFIKAVRARFYEKEAELMDKGFVVTAELLRDAYFDKVDHIQCDNFFPFFTSANAFSYIRSCASTNLSKEWSFRSFGCIFFGSSSLLKKDNIFFMLFICLRYQIRLYDILKSPVYHFLHFQHQIKIKV